MRFLDEILQQCPPQLPVVGQNGYGGEQDGTEVVFLGVLEFPARRVAHNIKIGDDIRVHWAEYLRGTGWQVSLAHWSDAKDVVIEIDDSTRMETRWR